MKSFFALIASIPTLVKIIDELMLMWIDHKVEQINREQITINDETNLLIKKIAEAKTNEERATLSVTLNRIIRM